MFMNLKKPIAKFLTLTIMLSMCIIATAPVNAEETDIIEPGRSIEKTVGRDYYIINETVKADYSIVPQIIPSAPEVDKEIFLVIDISSSMTRNVNGNSTYNENERRITIAKNAAKNFLENIKNISGVKVGIISYANMAYINQELIDINEMDGTTGLSGLEKLKNIINSMNCSVGTNIGDGLRRAYYELLKGKSSARKYIVFLTDGEPTNYSTDNEGKFYFGDGVAPSVAGGSWGKYEKDAQYAYDVADNLIKNFGITSYMVAFTSGSFHNIMENIANIVDGEYEAATTAGALNDVYLDISEKIVNDYSVSSVNFEEVFPDGLEIASVPVNFTVEGQKVTADLGKIDYQYNESTKQYEAAPIGFSIELKTKAAGEYLLGENNTSILSYNDINGTSKTKYFGEIPLTVEPFGKPELEVTGIVRNGETVDVKLRPKLPKHTDYAELRYEDGSVVPGFENIKGNDEIILKNLSIYKTYKVMLWAKGVSGEETESGSKTIFNAIDFN